MYHFHLILVMTSTYYTVKGNLAVQHKRSIQESAFVGIWSWVHTVAIRMQVFPHPIHIGGDCDQLSMKPFTHLRSDSGANCTEVLCVFWSVSDPNSDQNSFSNRTWNGEWGHTGFLLWARVCCSVNPAWIFTCNQEGVNNFFVQIIQEHKGL